ncbi:MAG: PilT/PilU family type 4a pilus ATPase [Candidatus Eremiobacteraeota bacterium]|nr:PilT/PilU family type 4a pilus ATPase [Candidatus Eremiobacteraeota bacterium]
MLEIESIRGLLDQVLTVMVREQASDVYIKAGKAPILRIEGQLAPVECAALTGAMTEHLAYTIMPAHQREKFDSGIDDANFIYNLDRVGRFRTNAYRARGSICMVLRRVSEDILEFEQLGLPIVLGELAMKKRGLVLLTGPTGSGKSTSLASMIKYRKEKAMGHILTIEDPIEYLHTDTETCIVSQREIGHDTKNFMEALESAVRQAPDVLLIGEMRDVESVKASVYFAETGHLVLSTLHANNAIQTVERVLQFFPEDMHQGILAQLSLNVRGIVAQRLIRGHDGKRVAACEVLIGNARMAELMRAGSLTQIKRELDQFLPEGMQSFDTSLLELYRAGKISVDEAIRNSDNANDMRLKIKSAMPVNLAGANNDDY